VPFVRPTPAALYAGGGEESALLLFCKFYVNYIDLKTGRTTRE
jgi:hypothetical protein